MLKQAASTEAQHLLPDNTLRLAHIPLLDVGDIFCMRTERNGEREGVKEKRITLKTGDWAA